MLYYLFRCKSCEALSLGIRRTWDFVWFLFSFPLIFDWFIYSSLINFFFSGRVWLTFSTPQTANITCGNLPGSIMELKALTCGQSGPERWLFTKPVQAFWRPFLYWSSKIHALTLLMLGSQGVHAGSCWRDTLGADDHFNLGSSFGAWMHWYDASNNHWLGQGNWRCGPTQFLPLLLFGRGLRNQEIKIYPIMTALFLSLGLQYRHILASLFLGTNHLCVWPDCSGNKSLGCGEVSWKLAVSLLRPSQI